jgi:hypothetical protein
MTADTITFDGYASSFTKLGNDLLIDGKLFKYQQPADGLRLEGKFKFVEPSGGSSLNITNYTFSADGSFKSESSSSYTATTSLAGTTTYSSGYSEPPIVFGKYTLRNNTIELGFEGGTVEKKVFHFETDMTGQVDYIYINGLVYSRAW